jgi:hypothetical protein
MALGALLAIGAAVLPVGAATERLGPFRVDVGADNCGPAGYVAFHRPDTDCGHAAVRRLRATTPVGLLLVALGMALFAGGDTARGSRIDVPTPRSRRGPPASDPGRRRPTTG